MCVGGGKWWGGRKQNWSDRLTSSDTLGTSILPHLCFSQKNLLVCDYRLLFNVMGTVSFDYLEGKEGGKREESIESKVVER